MNSEGSASTLPILMPEGSELIVAKGSRRKWDVTLRFGDDTPDIFISDFGQGDVKNLMCTKGRITVDKASNVKATTMAIRAGATLRGALADLYRAQAKQHARDEELAEYAKMFPPEALPTTPDGQKIIFDRLKALDGQKDHSATGHPSIQMTKIKLLNPVVLRVGGVDRVTNYLYTQPGNETEIRCYLGTAEGACQRVHTSITLDEESSAHTMVQTGANIIIPGYSDPSEGHGSRVGFDSSEGEAPGFANRDLSARADKRTAVTDWLDAESFETMSPERIAGCTLLANRFNRVLDQVCLDISTGDLGKRDVKRLGSDFAILDDGWLFDGSDPALPETELQDHQEQTKASEASTDAEALDDLSNWYDRVAQSGSVWASKLAHVSGAYSPSTNGVLNTTDVLIMLALTRSYETAASFWDAYHAFRTAHTGFRYRLAPVDIIHMRQATIPTELRIVAGKDEWDYVDDFARENADDYDFS